MKNHNFEKAKKTKMKKIKMRFKREPKNRNKKPSIRRIKIEGEKD